MLQKHTNKVSVNLNGTADSLALSSLVARFDLEGQLILESTSGTALNLTETLQKLKTQGLLTSAIATVWVPSTLVLLTQVFVPGKRRSDWMSALPYALEESLSEPVEHFHFVAFNRDAQGQVSTAIVEHKWMTAWSTTLAHHDLEHALLLPACFRVPNLGTEKTEQGGVALTEASTAQSCAIYRMTDNTLVRTGEFSGFAANQNWLPQIEGLQVVDGLSDGCVEVTQAQLLTSQKTAESSFNRYNLRTESYRPVSKSTQYWQEWRWPSVLLLLIIISSLVLTSVDSRKFAEQTADTQAQTVKLFKKMFPDAKRIVDIRIQTMTRLNQQQTELNPKLSAIQALRQVEPIFKKVPEVYIQKIIWQRGRLVITVDAEQTSQLQEIVKQAESANLAVKISLELKNVSPTFAEGVFNVEPK